MYKIGFNKEASIEMQKPFECYESNVKGFGERFFDNLDIYLNKICANHLNSTNYFLQKREQFIYKVFRIELFILYIRLW